MAFHYSTFSNAQKSEIMGRAPQPSMRQRLAASPEPHFFTFSLSHPRQGPNLDRFFINVSGNMFLSFFAPVC
jgi:hypothetical protein